MKSIGIRQSFGAGMPFLQGDPISKLLLERVQLDFRFASILILFGLPLPVYIMVSIDGLWQTRPGEMIGLLRDYGWWWFQFISWPVTIIYFFWLPRGIQAVLKGLQANGVIVLSESSPEKDYASFVRRFARSYCHPTWALLSLVILIIYMTSFIRTQSKFMLWPAYEGGVIFWYSQLVHAFMLYLAFLIAIRGIIVTIWLNRLFKEFQIDVKVLHPDKAGGLLPLGSFVGKVGWFIGLYGCTLIVVSLEHQYKMSMHLKLPEFTSEFTLMIGVMAIVYILLAPVIFFSILGSARSAMREAQSSLILQLSDQFKLDFSALTWSLESEADELEKKINKLEQLRKIHHMAVEFPVWPFDTRNIVRFFTSYFAPIILTLIGILLQKWIGGY